MRAHARCTPKAKMMAAFDRVSNKDKDKHYRFEQLEFVSSFTPPPA